MIQILRFAPIYQCHRALSQSGFDAHHGLRFRRRYVRLIAQQFKHLLHMRYIGLAQIYRLRVVFHVVIAIGQAQPSLVRFRNLLRSISEVLGGAETEEDVVIHHGRGYIGDLRLRINLRNALQIRLQRRQTLGINCLLVGAGRIVIADLLRGRVALGVRRGSSLQNPAQPAQVLVLHLRVDVPRRLVGRNRIVFYPSAAGILEEVHTRIYASIHGGDVQRRLIL